MFMLTVITFMIVIMINSSCSKSSFIRTERVDCAYFHWCLCVYICITSVLCRREGERERERGHIHMHVRDSRGRV